MKSRRASFKCLFIYSIVNILLFCFCNWLPAEGIPVISFSEDKWDFGTIKQGDKVSHIFNVTNSGVVTLNITKVKSTCGCTAVMLKKREFKKGEKGEIKATFDSKGRLGPFRKSIFIHSNDPSTPMRKLIVKGNIVSKQDLNIKFIPSLWNTGLIKQGEVLNKSINILNTGYKDISILEIKTTNNIIAVNKSSQIVTPGKVAKIRLTFNVPQITGRISEKITFFTDIPDLPTVYFFVRGTIVEENSGKTVVNSDKNILENG